MVRISIAMFNVEKLLQRNISLKDKCWFKTGGKADFFAKPKSIEELIEIRKYSISQNIPFFIIGEGANLLISDNGVEGIVVDLSNLNHFIIDKNIVSIGSGLSISKASKMAADANLSGLDFIFGMPGTVGGALTMNARCYGSEIADILISYKVLDSKCNIIELKLNRDEWAYKKTPFQQNNFIILEAKFKLSSGNSVDLNKKMKEIFRDRTKKGHFKAPCAGSTFKNNRDFGEPSGKIIEDCGFKGMKIGGAAVSDWHGNILINKNNATSRDIWNLIVAVQNGVEEKTGYRLEPEVLRVGRW